MVSDKRLYRRRYSHYKDSREGILNGRGGTFNANVPVFFSVNDHLYVLEVSNLPPFRTMIFRLNF